MGNENFRKDVIYRPFKPFGRIRAQSSKSDVHRAIICAALAKGKSVIRPVAASSDIWATIGCAEALGAKIEFEGNKLIVDGSDMFNRESAALNCGESGSTMRFFIPVAMAGGVTVKVLGRGSLLDRPVGPLSILCQKGVELCTVFETLPIKLKGKLQSGRFEVAGNISSQYISGLMFALPLLEGDSDIVLTTPLQSEGYVNMTVKTMKSFGVEVERTDFGWHIKGSQSYKPTEYRTEGDWSQAAFFMALGALAGDVTVIGLNTDSLQGDKKIVELLSDFGADITLYDKSVRVRESKLKGIDIDASQIPDLVPVLAVCASVSSGVTNIINAERLRIKESDRLKSTAALLSSIGAEVEELESGLRIVGRAPLCGGSVNGFKDHRIVMAAGVSACVCEGNVTCSDAMSIEKSYPNFYKHYNRIGGKADVLGLR